VGVRIDTDWTHHGLRCLRIENRSLALDVLPQRGGNLFRLIDKRRDVDVLWKNPRVPPQLAPLQGNFDDLWAGGWDEAFPGGAPSPDRYGEQLPYMGEVWQTPARWTVEEASGREVVLRLEVTTPITPARLTRWVTIRDDEPLVHVRYRIEHLGVLPFDYTWGTHPSLAITPQHRFDVPATAGEVDDHLGTILGERGDRYAWPIVAGRDVRTALPPEAGVHALHYLTGLREGWVAATDTAARAGVGFCFDVERFPVVWLVLVYGGFRGFYQALLEPWTGYPTRLADAVAAGRANVLAPGETVETEVTAVLYAGVDAVTALRPDGSVS
jgi:galactose mutarotase-like enzyme